MIKDAIINAIIKDVIIGISLGALIVSGMAFVLWMLL